MERLLNSAEISGDSVELSIGDFGYDYGAAASDTAFDKNSGVILTSTLWNQDGTVYVNVNGKQTALSDYTYNQYCPDVSSSDKTKTLTGCTNTADSQVLYYWLEQGYDLKFSVSTSDYFYLETSSGTTSSKSYDRNADMEVDNDATIYYVSNTSNVGEGTLSAMNSLLSSANKVGNGDFIAALNFYCGVKNHSTYGKDGTSTTWNYGAYTDGTNAEAYKAAGLDSYYFISREGSASASGILFTTTGLSDVGYSIVREVLDYGEPIRVGIPGHAIYMDGYRPASGGYEYHLNYGWGVGADTTRWYTDTELSTTNPSSSNYITYIIIDMSPDIQVNVTSSRGDYYGGSFIRGIERINHIQNDKSTTFSFDAAVAGSVIAMSESSAVTSGVDLEFKNINAAVTTTADTLLSSARGMTFDFTDGAMAVNSSAASAVIKETGNKAVEITLDSSYLYSGHYSAGVTELNSLLNKNDGYTYGEFDKSFYTSVKGNAVQSGAADDIVKLTKGSAIFGGLSLGAGNNLLEISNGSLYCGSFTGTAGTLTANLTIDSPDYTGALIAVNDSSSFSAFTAAVNGVLNVTMSDAVLMIPQVYTLVSGPSAGALQNIKVNLTAPGVSETLSYQNPNYGSYTLTFDNERLGLLYSPGSVEKNLVNLYYGPYLINSDSSMDNASVGSGITMEVLNGGTAIGTTVKASGTMNVSAGAIVDGTISAVGGVVNVFSGASISNSSISGTVNIQSGSSAVNSFVSSTGTVNLAAGSSLSGKLSIAAGGTVSAEAGSSISMDLRGVDPASSNVLIENINLISGSPKYVVCIDKIAQAEGKYRLASGIGNFTSSITITTPEKELATLSVGETMRSNGFSCTLQGLDEENRNFYMCSFNFMLIL